MSTDSLFRPLGSSAATVPVTFNNQARRLPAASSVAAALLAGGVQRFRSSPVSGDGRAPYCMMGVCFECLLTIDGIPNRQGCLAPLQAGMVITTQDSILGPSGTSDERALDKAGAAGAHHAF